MGPTLNEIEECTISPKIPDRLLWALEVLAPDPADDVLEIGCGTGVSVADACSEPEDFSWEGSMKPVLRQAHRDDITGMHRVRLAVRENRLVSAVISEADYLREIESTGRGWVIEAEGTVLAFAIGSSQTGNIWALFVDPDHERLGYGKRLHDEMVHWLWAQGLERLWLTTSPGTRAERFYESAGWRNVGRTESGEIRFELVK